MQQGFRYLLIGLIIVVTILSGQQRSVVASPAPNSDEFAQIQPGEAAVTVTLPNLQGNNVTIDFKGRPTVIVSLHEFRINRLTELQTFYDKNKQSMNFYIVCHSDAESVQKVFSTCGFTMPVLLDDKREFMKTFNVSLPSMVISDKHGITQYNGTAFVKIESLNDYIDKLSADNTKEPPKLLLDPPNYAQPAPPTMKIGDVVHDERLYDMEGNYITIKFSDKPTVLLFWAGFNSSVALDRTFPVIQEAYQTRGNKANFYIVNFGSHPEQVQEVLNGYNITVPSLLDKYPRVNLKYTASCPTFVIIDQNGAIRFRPQKTIDTEQLEAIIDSLNSPDNEVLKAAVKDINAVEDYFSLPHSYQNDGFRCKMTLPIGWSDTSMTNRDVIYLYRKIPMINNGKQMAAIMEMRKTFLNGPFKTLNELPKDRLEELKLNLTQLTKDSIRNIDNVTVDGITKDIGKHKVILIISSGQSKVIQSYFVEDGYMWSLRVGVPNEYFDAMLIQMEQIIESFEMI
jgi:peroxiredoxin